MFGTKLSAMVGAQLLLASVAHATTTLVTPPLPRIESNQLSCMVTNAGPSEIPVEIRIMNGNGMYVGGDTVVLSPGETGSSSHAGVSSNHCEFNLNGNARRVRAAACTGPIDGDCTAVAPAY